MLRILIFVSLLLVAGCLPTGPGSRTLESSKHTLIERTLPEEGIRRSDKFLTIENQPGELVWITGCSLETLADDALPRPLLSRVSLVFKNAVRHNFLLGLSQNPQGMLFRFSPGVESVRFPEGFGVPVFSNEPIFFGSESQIAEDPPQPAEVSFKLKLDYVRQRGLSEPYKPLYCLQMTSLVSVGSEPLHFGVTEPDPDKQGPGAPLYPIATSTKTLDGLGHEFADTWYLPPGEQTNRSLMTKILSLESDTKLHLATGHMMPFGTSLELFDRTAGRAVVRLEKSTQGPGLQQFQSLEGVDLFKDHEYDLVATFHNTTGGTAKASAQMMIYIETPEFNLNAHR